MIDLVFQEMMKDSNRINQNYAFYALDSSVGDGRFLFSFLSRWNEMGFNKRELYLHGLDIDTESVAKCLLQKDDLPTVFKSKFDFKKGNALIGFCAPPEFHETEKNLEFINNCYFNEIGLMDSNLERDLIPFHWYYEWPEPLKNGGYDLCIGNPPFGISFTSTEKNIFKNQYEAIDPESESYLLFVERSINLLKEGGILVLLLPNNFVTNYRYFVFRKFLLENLKIQKIIMLSDNVFSDVSVETCILVATKNTPSPQEKNNKIEFSKYSAKEGLFQIGSNDQKRIMAHKYHFLLPETNKFYPKIQRTIEKNSIPLGEIVNISRGIELGFTSSYTSDHPISTSSVPLVACRNIHPFSINDNIRYIEFNTENKSIYKDRSLYLQPKILLRRIGHDLVAAYDKNNLFCVCDVYILTLKPKWINIDYKHLEALLNSTVLTFYLNQEFKSIKKIFPKIPISYLKKLPIKLPFSEEYSSIIRKKTIEGRELSPESHLEIDQIIGEHYEISKDQFELIHESVHNR
jgi:hypothetical protein